jgi:F-type H+-transporting ATPase subunit b
MTHRRLARAVGGMLLLVLFAAISVRAAEEGGNSATERVNEMFKWINFAIVLAVLVWVFGKVLPPRFRKNADTISSAIAKATLAKAEAERQVRESEGKLANLQRELEQVRTTAQGEASAEAERIRNLARSDAERVRLAAKAEIEAAERAARLELKTIAANLAVDRAEALLVQELTPKTQHSLVSAFLQSLEARPN